MALNRILFRRTRKNPNSIAALVGALEVAQGITRVESAPRPDLPALENWSMALIESRVPVDAASSVEDPFATLDDDRFDLTVVAYSFMSLDRDGVAEEVAMLRSRASNGRRLVFIAGGAHTSGDPDAGLAMGFDHVFVGEAEMTLPITLDRLARGLFVAPRIKPDHAPLNLDAFLSFAPAHGFLAPIELGRGCPFACKFCHVPSLQGRRMRHRSVESVLEHVRMAVARGRVRTWFVTSDAFAYGSASGEQGVASECERLLRGCKEAGLKEVFWGGFPSEVRPDHVQDDLLELVVRHCANRTLVLGAQSGSDAVLRETQRGHGAAVVRSAVRKVRAFGLIPHVDYIFGLPGETAADRRLTMDAIEAIVADGGKVHMHYFMPHPGTPWADARPEVVEPDILVRVEKLTGAAHADGYWRRQRLEASRTNPEVLASHLNCGS